MMMNVAFECPARQKERKIFRFAELQFIDKNQLEIVYILPQRHIYGKINK